MKWIAALGAVAFALACASPPEPPRGPAPPPTPAPSPPPIVSAVAAPVPSPPAPIEAPEPEPAPPEPPNTERITLKVPGDNPIEVVLGPRGSPQAIVYLHGVCGDPFAFESWTRAATAHATFISLRGDEKCDDRPGRFRWSFDYARLDRRIRAAVDLVDTHRSGQAKAVALDREEVVLVGYSQGAHRAQWMAARYPERYRRVGLIALATEPSEHRLARAERVLLVAGGWDARTHIFAGYEALKRADKAVLYVELPKARHGEYGPRAEETMSEALDWLFK